MKVVFGIVLAACLSLVSIASAEGVDQAGKRTVDFDAPIIGLDGRPVPDTSRWPVDPATGKPRDGVPPAALPPLTLGGVASSVLAAPEHDLSTIELFRRGELADRISHGGKLWLSSEELALIEKLLPKSGSPLITFRVMRLLGEPDPK